jgi:predicted DNA-binding protein (MmcQ/YjbR family)
MNIDRSKLDRNFSGETEAVNIKSDKEKISTLIKQKGFYPAYHMNKKNWVTVILDDTVDDDLLFELVDESHAFTLDKRAHR